MGVKAPTRGQLNEIAESLGMALDQEELAEYITDMQHLLDGCYAALDSKPDYIPACRYPRTPGFRPDDEEDRLHAWYVKTSIKGAEDGPLAGRKVAVKDNVCVAGVPMMNGSSTLEGYTPDIDATIVTRLLDAGAEIAGKTHCEYFCASGGSHTNATGPTHNPHKRGHSAGGSSSGSAAVVADGQADMAIGGDQGGSIRIPSALCGVYGMKPTYGLVPYTGIMPVELTLDHAGPITSSVSDNARMLDVIAGRDGLDPRQQDVRVANYADALTRGVLGLRIGVLQEGFEWEVSNPAVDDIMKSAAHQFEQAGASVRSVSIPMHRESLSIWAPIVIEGATDLLLHGNGLGTNWRGLYPTSLLDVHAKWRLDASSFPVGLKTFMMLGEHVRRTRRGHYYAKAQNLARKLREHYDAALETVDLLAMPTVPMLAPPLPGADAGRAELMAPGFDILLNTAAFDCTGHPAMSIPCGMSDGLPVGMMLVAKHFDEAVIYRAAQAFEQAVDWRST